MAIYYIDLYNGNDASDGTSWATAWKTITNGATAARIAPGDTIRISKSPDPAGIGLATWTDLSKVVELATAQTLNIELCETAWTASANVTATASATRKQGSYAAQMVIGTAFTTGKVAYKALAASLDLSGYQKISFWFRNTTAIASETVLRVCLCSDAVGDTVVDSFAIPAIPSTSRFLPLTLERTGGGNLGASIQSVAIYADADPGTPSLIIDDIIACKADGLSLNSLISKNANAIGSQEGLYGIQNINGTTINIDTQTETYANAGFPYQGETGTFETYIRAGYNDAVMPSTSAVANTIQDTGNITDNIQFIGGVDPATDEINGLTILDGLNGYGYGISASNKQYLQFYNFGLVRYYVGFYLMASIGSIIKNCLFSNNSSYSISANSLNNITIDSCIAINNQGASVYLSYVTNSLIINCVLKSSAAHALYLNQSSNNVVTNTLLLYSSSYGLRLDKSQGCTFNNCEISYGGNNGIYSVSSNFITANNCTFKGHSSIVVNSYGGCNWIFKYCYFTGNNGIAITINDGNINLYNTIIDDSSEFGPIDNGSDAYIQSFAHDNVAGNNLFLSAYALSFWQTDVKFNNVGSWATVNYNTNPLKTHRLKLGEVCFKSGSPVVIKATAKKQQPTGVVCRLIVLDNPALGIEQIYATKADDTDWEELSISFTPSTAGVVEVYFETWYVTQNQATYVGPINATQS